jgi:hypothetical protein
MRKWDKFSKSIYPDHVNVERKNVAVNIIDYSFFQAYQIKENKKSFNWESLNC